MAFLHGKNNINDYLSNLPVQIYPMVAELLLQGNAIFLDGNTPIHRGKVVSQWHEDYPSQVEHLIRPPNTLKFQHY